MWSFAECNHADAHGATPSGAFGDAVAVSGPPPPAAQRLEPKDLLDELFSSPTEPTETPRAACFVQDMAQGDKSTTAQPPNGDDSFFQLFGESVTVATDMTGCSAPATTATTVLDAEQLEERRLLFERLVSDEVPRWYEANIILQSLRSSLECDMEERQQGAGRQVAESQSLEAAAEKEVTQRYDCVFASTASFVEFLNTFKHVSAFPTLHNIQLATTLRKCVQEWVESHGGFRVVLLDSALIQDLQTLIGVVDEVYNVAALSSPHSAPEALLLAALTDLCRYCMHMACNLLSQKDYSFLGRTMNSMMEQNYSHLTHIEEEMRNHQAVLQLLVVARSTAYHRCSEDVLASVSPLIAEVLSIFDMLSSVPIVPLDKGKTTGARCKLSGLRLDSGNASDIVHDFVRRYWEKVVPDSAPFPM
ncbi:hypothetical protein DQ04_01611050 [Trypanosoma grayi]|uniref:hypothetical protein n=1 Tax=Trypanosoma grayi TaxID=71804 RepID=UPI0004F49D2E|nr:hypothetical protein DQ04_01611050 [Trypanosoma grayi]KEG12563.1 hypothetical protein DQ04_01611050 [Trypanosoma grayi]